MKFFKQLKMLLVIFLLINLQSLNAQVNPIDSIPKITLDESLLLISIKGDNFFASLGDLLKIKHLGIKYKVLSKKRISKKNPQQGKAFWRKLTQTILVVVTDIGVRIIQKDWLKIESPTGLIPFLRLSF